MADSRLRSYKAELDQFMSRNDPVGLDKLLHSLIDKLLKSKLVNAASASGSTPLFGAAWDGQAEIAEVLLKHGAKVNWQNTRGNTATHLAIEQNHVDFCEVTLRAGADIAANVPAIIRRKTKKKINRAIDQLIIEEHERREAAEAEKRMIEGNTITGSPLWRAVENNDIDAIHNILYTSAGRNAVTRPAADGTTLLHVAAQRGFAHVAEILLHRKADVEARDNNGRSVLEHAIAHNQFQVCKLLLMKHNANTWAIDLDEVAMWAPANVSSRFMHLLNRYPSEGPSFTHEQQAWEATYPDQEWLARQRRIFAFFSRGHNVIKIADLRRKLVGTRLGGSGVNVDGHDKKRYQTSTHGHKTTHRPKSSKGKIGDKNNLHSRRRRCITTQERLAAEADAKKAALTSVQMGHNLNAAARHDIGRTSHHNIDDERVVVGTGGNSGSSNVNINLQSERTDDNTSVVFTEEMLEEMMSLACETANKGVNAATSDGGATMLVPRTEMTFKEFIDLQHRAAQWRDTLRSAGTNYFTRKNRARERWNKLGGLFGTISVMGMFAAGGKAASKAKATATRARASSTMSGASEDDQNNSNSGHYAKKSIASIVRSKVAAKRKMADDAADRAWREAITLTVNDDEPLEIELEVAELDKLHTSLDELRTAAGLGRGGRRMGRRERRRTGNGDVHRSMSSLSQHDTRRMMALELALHGEHSDTTLSQHSRNGGGGHNNVDEARLAAAERRRDIADNNTLRDKLYPADVIAQYAQRSIYYDGGGRRCHGEDVVVGAGDGGAGIGDGSGAEDGVGGIGGGRTESEQRQQMERLNTPHVGGRYDPSHFHQLMTVATAGRPPLPPPSSQPWEQQQSPPPPLSHQPYQQYEGAPRPPPLSPPRTTAMAHASPLSPQSPLGGAVRHHFPVVPRSVARHAANAHHHRLSHHHHSHHGHHHHYHQQEPLTPPRNHYVKSATLAQVFL